MGNNLQIQVENLKEVSAAIRRLGDADLRQQLKAANKNISQSIVDAALPDVPVRTGKLRASVKAQATTTSAYGKAGTPARVPYAAAIHWGVGARPGRGPHNIKGRPFLSDAAKKVEGRAIKEYEDQIRKLIKQVMK